MQGGRVCAFDECFESKQFDEINLTLKNHLKNYNYEISTVIDKDLE